MSKETLDAIDAAVRAHWAELLKTVDDEVKPVVTGWVVTAEIQTLENGDIMWDNDYCVSETTSPNAALGLGVWLSDSMRGIQADMEREDDDDD